MPTKKMPDAAEIAEKAILNHTGDAFFDIDFNKAKLAIMEAIGEFYKTAMEYIDIDSFKIDED